MVRRPRRDDEPLYRALFFAPEVAAWLRPPPLPPFALDDPAQALESDLVAWERDGFGFAILEAADGTFLGRGGMRVDVFDSVPEVELGWALLPEHWGRGYATEMARGAVEAARGLEMETLIAVTLHRNTASRRVMERVGMAYERDTVHAGLPHVLYRLALV